MFSGIGAGLSPASPASRTALAGRGVAAHVRTDIVRCVDVCIVGTLILLTRRCARRSRRVAVNRSRPRQVSSTVRHALVAFCLSLDRYFTVAARTAPPPPGPFFSDWRTLGCSALLGRAVNQHSFLDRLGRVERRGNGCAGLGAGRPLSARLPWRTRRTGDWLIRRRSLGRHGSAFRSGRALSTHRLLLTT